jgi:hypothetical protein
MAKIIHFWSDLDSIWNEFILRFRLFCVSLIYNCQIKFWLNLLEVQPSNKQNICFDFQTPKLCGIFWIEKIFIKFIDLYSNICSNIRVSISTTFYTPVFHMKVLFCQNVTRKKLPKSLSYKKCVRKTFWKIW